MVSGSAISTDRDLVEKNLKNAKKALNSLDGSWEGESQKALTEKFNEFYGEVKNVLSDMDSFKTAVDLYEEYEEVKSAKATAKDNFDAATTDAAKEKYRGEYKELKEKLKSLEKQIKSALNSISGVKGVKDSSNLSNPSLQAFGDLAISGNLVPSGDYMMLNCNYDDLIQTFGGQCDDVGYAAEGQGCDNYSRLYALYIVSGGKVKASSADLGTPYDGFTKTNIDAASEGGTASEKRKRQAQVVYDTLNKGVPCVLHVNSNVSNNGHWLCAVGYKNGVTRDNVTVKDLVVVDSAATDVDTGNGTTAMVRPMSDVPNYCLDDDSRCNSDDSPWETVSFTPNN